MAPEAKKKAVKKVVKKTVKKKKVVKKATAEVAPKKATKKAVKKTTKKVVKKATKKTVRAPTIGLTPTEAKNLRSELASCHRPLIFFHDDADGLCSFLQVYKFVGDGKGVIIKSTPHVQDRYIRKVREYQPDKIFILDLAEVDQEFINRAGVPVVWVDHHGPFERKNVKYFNPRVRNPEKNAPASYLVYQAIKDNEWIAMAGIVGDWFLTPLAKKFSKNFPDLLPKETKTPQEALFSTQIGKMAHIINMALKGNANEAMKYAKVMTRIHTPDEILNQSSSKGKYVYKKYARYHREYVKLFKDATRGIGKSKFLVYEYPNTATAFGGELSNELLYRYPEKVIVVAREHSGMMRCSVRSAGKTIVSIPMQKALAKVEGHGGGHEHACGCSVPADLFPKFIKELKKEVKDYHKDI